MENRTSTKVLEFPLLRNGLGINKDKDNGKGDNEDEDEEGNINLMIHQQKSTLFDQLFPSSFNSSTSNAERFVIPTSASLVHHSFRALLALKSNRYIFFYYNGSWSDVFIKTEKNIQTMEWDYHTDRLYVGTDHGLIICYKFTSLDSNDLSQYSASSIQLNLPPAILSMVATPLCVHSLKSCPRGRFLAILSSTSVSGWSYQEITLWDCYSSLSTPLTVSGYGWKYKQLDHFCCLEWCPSGQYLAIGASDGSVVVVNTMTWKSSECCLMSTSITSLVWINSTDFLFSTLNQTTLQAVHISSSSQVLEVPEKSHSSSADEDIYPSISPSPINLSSQISSILTNANLTEIPIDSVVVEKIKIVPQQGDILAVSFRSNDFKTDPRGVKLPFVALFLCSSRSFISLCLLRVLYPPPSPLKDEISLPVDFVFQQSSSKNSAVIVYWSNRIMTIEEIN